MYDNIKLYRKRFIPNEINYLKDDEILLKNDELIITKWNTLKPRTDIARGISAYILNEGLKVSKIYDKDSNLVYWYCDMIRVKKEEDNYSIIFEDLLLDVVVYQDGFVKVLDIGELAEALEKQYIDVPTAVNAMKTLEYLLEIIYRGEFYRIQEYINNAEQELKIP